MQPRLFLFRIRPLIKRCTITLQHPGTRLYLPRRVTGSSPKILKLDNFLKRTPLVLSLPWNQFEESVVRAPVIFLNERPAESKSVYSAFQQCLFFVTQKMSLDDKAPIDRSSFKHDWKCFNVFIWKLLDTFILTVWLN